MNVNNPPKFLLLLIGLIGMFVLVLVDPTVSLGDVDQYLTLILGYGVGNGIAAKRGQPVEPVFGRRPNDQQD